MIKQLPPLTRRRDPEHPDCWHIMCGDVRAGSISIAAGLPNAAREWKWSAGFYPGSHPGEIKQGTADTFDEARAAFRAAWRDFVAKRTEADFAEWREQQEWTASKYAARDHGKEVPNR